jgi:hypothetical protein
MKIKLFLSAVTLLTMVGALIGIAGVAHAEAVCDPAFVSEMGGVITVQPTGISDTSNLQCAFDLAIATGPGLDVHLLPGVYHIGMIFVNNFHGKFTGSGMDATVITNLPDLYVTPVDVIFQPPSPDNVWPDLISFLGGDFVISDMAIKITGDQPTLPWTIFGIDPPLRQMSAAVLVTGNEVTAKIERLLVEGEAAPDSIFGFNLINGAVLTGHYGSFGIQGSYTVSDSIFAHLASGLPITGPVNSSILITRNTFDDVIYGLDGGEFLNSRFEFSHNKVNAVIGFDLYNAYTPEDSGSKFLIKNNVFRGAVGPAFEQNFGEGNQCLIIGNNVRDVTDVGIFLGPNISGCTVVGGGTVLDLGTGNVLVGVNNMGTGVGPRIQTLLKMFK